MTITISRPRALRGTITAPGDKSVSHRAAIFNALAEGESLVTNFSPGNDCTSTVQMLRTLGVRIERNPSGGDAGDTLRITGAADKWSEPAQVLDAGNSGTTMRLMSGALAGRDFVAVMSGDESLNGRPMGRVVKPLCRMGAEIRGRKDDSLAPLVFQGGRLRGIDYEMPVASAQLKSALLIAGLRAGGRTRISQPALSRDHTERMLGAMGATLDVDGLDVAIEPGRLHAVDVQVPGDISSAAFWIIAALVHPDAELTILGVGINPSRAGLLTALTAMHARLELTNERDVAGEPVADVVATSSQLQGAEIAGDLVPLLIDEIPALAVAAAMAEGVTTIRDAAELRVKESDRIEATLAWLRAAGVECEGRADGMSISGSGRLMGGNFDSFDDHRLAMSLGVAGLAAEGPVTVNGSEAASVSYPAFWEEVRRLGGVIG